MEEEIKVLENCWVMTTDHVLDEGNIALKLAIKNFIKGYRQLEKENKELKGKYNIQPVLVNNSMFFIDNELYENLLVDINKNYIPKSVIREKIEEIRKTHSPEDDYACSQIHILKKILGGSNE